MIPPKKKGARILWTTALLTLAWGILWAVRLQWASPAESLWTSLLFVLCVFPSILFVAGHRFRIPFMPMWGLGYFMMFGVPMLSRGEQADIGFVPVETVTGAIQLAVLGAAACLAAFYTPLGKWAEGIVPRIKAPWDSKRAPRRGVELILLGMALHYLEQTTTPGPTIAQLLFIGSQISILGMLTLFLLQLRGQLSKKLRFFLWGFVAPVEFLLGVGTGAIFNAIVRVAPLLFCYAAERGKIPWQWMAFLALCVVPFSGFKSEYRSYAWYGESGDVTITASPLRRGMAFVQLIIKRLTEGGIEAYTVAAERAHGRVSHLGLLITMMEVTPRQIPFWRGETYAYVFWSLAPRVLFPDKPGKTTGQEFGHRYDLLHEEDLTTSFNLPHQVVEMYINFGTVGVLAGMAFLGGLYRGISVLLGHPEAGERGLIIGCGLLANLLSLDTDFSLVFGGVVYYILIMYMATRILRPPKTADSL